MTPHEKLRLVGVEMERRVVQWTEAWSRAVNFVDGLIAGEPERLYLVDEEFADDPGSNSQEILTRDELEKRYPVVFKAVEMLLDAGFDAGTLTLHRDLFRLQIQLGADED